MMLGRFGGSWCLPFAVGLWTLTWLFCGSGTFLARSVLSIAFLLLKTCPKPFGLSTDFLSLSLANGLYGGSSWFLGFWPHFGSFGGGGGGTSSVVHKRSVILLCFRNLGLSGFFENWLCGSKLTAGAGVVVFAEAGKARGRDCPLKGIWVDVPFWEAESPEGCGVAALEYWWNTMLDY